MTGARLGGLCPLILGGLVLSLWGTVLATSSPAAMFDFRGHYYAARCLIEHCDPYNASEVAHITRANGGDLASDSARMLQVLTQFPYPPTTFAFTVPIAMLPWGPAHMLWILVTEGSLFLASFLIWSLGADYAPIVSGVLAGFLLANSEVLMLCGNDAGIAVGLCVVAVWCFLRERFVPAGIFCLAVSLSIKPHDAGLVWIYFLLAGGVYRKRALQTLLVAVALSLPGVLWVWHVAPNWIQELHSNIAAYFVYGGPNDPGPASTSSHGLGMVTCLQSVISIFRDDPKIYNLVSYLVCAPLLLVWAFVTLRVRSSPMRAWLAIAAIAPLSLLPVYHRLVDAKLLLLTLPACALLCAQGGLTGRLALLVNAAGFVSTGDLPWAFTLGLIRNLHLSTTELSGQILTVVMARPVPLILLVMSIFYLWIYARHKPNLDSEVEPGELKGNPCLADDAARVPGLSQSRS